jgi:HSP20 family protein
MGSFKRSFNLPENVNLDGITASYNNGILTVTIPKVIEVPENKVKQIAIQ